MFKKTRNKWTKRAFKNGKREHKYGRRIAIPIILSMLYSIYIKEYILFTLTTLTFICWIIYLLSHTREKYCFKKAQGGPRG